MLPDYRLRLAGCLSVALLLLVAGCGGGSGASGAAGAAGSGSGGPAALAPASSSSSSSSSASATVTAELPLPAITLATDGGAAIASKDDYVSGRFVLSRGGVKEVDAKVSIKGHGNTTWGMPKKPYRIKLDDKAGLLDMPKDKNWILLANYSDKTLLRNRMAFEVSRRLGMAWTPRAAPVEVTLNGDYVGVYDLVEKIGVDKNRINITETETTTPAADGGYLMEINYRLDDPVCWQTTHAVPFCLSEPDASTDGQITYVKGYVQAAEDALYSGHATDPTTGYEAYIDVDSLIDWYLVNELFKNWDSAFGSSVYLYKDKGGRLTFGPVWDFDLGAGNMEESPSPQGYQTAYASWIQRMNQIDPTFRARVRARWDAVRAAQLDTLPAWIDTRAAELRGAEQRNFARWPILGTYVWPNPEVAGSYQGEVDYLKDWLVKRIAWMDANL